MSLARVTSLKINGDTFIGDRTPIQNLPDGKEEVCLVCMQIWSNGDDSSLPSLKCGFDSRYLLFADIAQW